MNIKAVLSYEQNWRNTSGKILLGYGGALSAVLVLYIIYFKFNKKLICTIHSIKN